MPFLIQLHSPHAQTNEPATYLCDTGPRPAASSLSAARIWHRLTTQAPAQATHFTVLEKTGAQCLAQLVTKKAGISTSVIYILPWRLT